MPGSFLDADKDIYDPDFVSGVFDRCSNSYRWWSQIASFGFVWLWRRQCIDTLPAFENEAARGFDLMAGTGEAWPYLLKRRKNVVSITAIDISTEMVKRAIVRLHSFRSHKINVQQANFLDVGIDPECADFAICTFGMKTFNRDQQTQFAKQLSSMLKPGGVFSLVEASDPKGWIFRPFYLLYLRRVLPIVERVFLNGANDFSMLGVYAPNFGDCGHLYQCLKDEGLEVTYQRYFFGCATGVTGRKSVPSPK